ncbi:MAG: dihydrolipoamide acetyltransferase family protein [Thiomonas sp.]|uniref:dihydrolipoamide acetyltransferase family protein n=1 Tax=Thiomonas sp. TaxID=2047785 RepID=UPI002A36D7F7|nr:dihydrolipoamide acetyltransferase family protein [Thiomonas sp.]MDY0330881.1 dihydrolipoamide acetyltransferase family protein [Thiomonas sp.]
MTRTAVILPVLSDTMQTGRIARWLKQPGDAVKAGEVLAEVESDKAIMDVEAYADGVLAGPLAPVDSDIAVKSTIAWIDDAGSAPAPHEPAQPGAHPSQTEAPSPESNPAPTPSVPQPEPHADSFPASAVLDAALAARSQGNAGPPQVSLTPSGGGSASRPWGRTTVGASPFARGLAAELDIDLALLRPDAQGRITAAQVLAAAIGPQLPHLQLGPVHRIERPSSLKAAMAENMQRTVHTPTFHVTTAVDLQALHAAAQQAHRSVSLLLARACALTLQKHPDFNACWTPGGLARRETIDIAIAVDTADGLMTPVLRNAVRALSELDEDWRELREKVARRRLAPADYTGATFYLSNLGMFAGVEQFDAIVPLGAAAILAVAAPARDGLTRLTLTCDHRVVAGADAARFLATLDELLRAPEGLMA